MSYDYKNMMGKLITEASILNEIMELVKSEPNNMELGKKIRALYYKHNDEKDYDQLNLFGEGDY